MDTHYESELQNNYEWIHLMTHSNPMQHVMEVPNEHGTFVHNFEVSEIDPVANFYNFFSCTVGNYTWSLGKGYIGGHYIFSESYSLSAIASTKIGGMRNCDYFYNALTYDWCIGRAFHQWHWSNGEYGAGDKSRVWHYGLTILGDPTLVPNMP
jgi:hypothetical protein